jgi:hypothetical protein
MGYLASIDERRFSSGRASGVSGVSVANRIAVTSLPISWRFVSIKSQYPEKENKMIG